MTFKKPKYQIGDRLPNSNIYVRGIAQLSNGKYRYFLQIFDNTLVLEAKYLNDPDYFAKIMKLELNNG